MSSGRGRPTTTGRSHRTPMHLKELLENWFRRKNKNYINSCDNFFKPQSSDRQVQVTNVDTTANCIETACSDSTCSEDSVSESEPEASQMSISESIETQRNCFAADPQSSSNTPEIPKENSFYSGTRSSAVIDCRITDDKLCFTIKWEKRFTWAYYSSYHAGWFYRTCQKYSKSYDQYWKTVPRTHEQHPGIFFSEHENCQKHVRAVSLIKITSRNYWLKGKLFVR